MHNPQSLSASEIPSTRPMLTGPGMVSSAHFRRRYRSILRRVLPARQGASRAGLRARGIAVAGEHFRDCCRG